MILEVIGGLAACGALGFFVRQEVRYQRESKEEDKYLLNAEPAAIKGPERWLTVGSYQLTNNFTDTKRPFGLAYILRVSNKGNRKVDFEPWPVDCEQQLKKIMPREDAYIIYLEPWAAGSLSIETVKKHLPGLKLVPADAFKHI